MALTLSFVLWLAILISFLLFAAFSTAHLWFLFVVFCGHLLNMFTVWQSLHIPLAIKTIYMLNACYSFSYLLYSWQHQSSQQMMEARDQHAWNGWNRKWYHVALVGVLPVAQYLWALIALCLDVWQQTKLQLYICERWWFIFFMQIVAN